MSLAPSSFTKKLKELVTRRENGTSHSLQNETNSAHVPNLQPDAPNENRAQTKGNTTNTIPSSVPLPTSSSEEKVPENNDMILEHKASQVKTPGGEAPTTTETPMGPHPAIKTDHHKRPSSPATSKTTIEVWKPKRKLTDETPALNKRNILFPPRKKHKDASWTNPTNSTIPPTNSNNKDRIPVDPDVSVHHNQRQPQQWTITQQPRPLPKQEWTNLLRSFRDDIVSQIGQQHSKTIEKLGKKIDLLSSQNAALNKKLQAITWTLGSSDKVRRPNNSPTPPLQLPSILITNTNARPPQPPPAPEHPPEAPVEISSEDHQAQQLRDDGIKIGHHPEFKGDLMSLDQADLNSLPDLRSIPSSILFKSNNHIHVNPQNHDHINNKYTSNIEEPAHENKHFSWLKQQFKNCFGLPTDSYKRRGVYSFDGVLLAEGFNKVVATWQGLFYELKGEDIIFENLDRSFNTARGTTIWSTKGVQITKLHREDMRTTPRPHRFAVVHRGNSSRPCYPLHVGKFYVHVYQTKLKLAENFFKTLNSKAIARNLKEMYGIRYLPRPNDLPREPNKDNYNQQNWNPPRQQRPPQ